MRFDITQWAEFDLGDSIPLESGMVHILATNDICVFASNDGVSEILIGKGSEIRKQLKNASFCRCEGPKGTRIFAFWPEIPRIQSTGDILTNVDRQPMESGSLLEVRKAHRRFALESAATMEKMRRLSRGLLAEMPEKEKPTEPEKETPAKVEEPEQPEKEKPETAKES